MMKMAMAMMMAGAPAGQAATVIDVGNGPVATTTVAVTVLLDAEGRVVSCRAVSGGACAGFPKGRVVSSPIRRNGKPVAGKMTVSTTTVVSE